MTMDAGQRDLRESSPAPRIVVADGDADFRRCVGTLLEAKGFAVVGEAEDGAQAIALGSEVDPSVVLLDARFAGGGGIEVASRLLARHGELAVVLVSGRDRWLHARPNLVDAVNVGAGFVSASKSAPASVQQVE